MCPSIIENSEILWGIGGRGDGKFRSLSCMSSRLLSARHVTLWPVSVTHRFTIRTMHVILTKILVPCKHKFVLHFDYKCSDFDSSFNRTSLLYCTSRVVWLRSQFALAQTLRVCVGVHVPRLYTKLMMGKLFIFPHRFSARIRKNFLIAKRQVFHSECLATLRPTML